MYDGGQSPVIGELSREEIDSILARNHVGRIGYARANRIDIRPVHYVYSDGWIYGRTSHGEKFDVLSGSAYQWWPVVFEVDEVEELYRWRSVLVHGGFYVLSREGTASDHQTWQNALDILRTLVPAALRADDPLPLRTILFRIAVQEAAGREAIPG